MRFSSLVLTGLILSGPATAQDHSRGPDAATAPHGPAWTYGGPTGPESWGRLDPTYVSCGSGQQASPIDLTAAISADLGPLDPKWLSMPGRVFDTGHAIQVELSEGSTLSMGGKSYQLLQFHVHQPSEHLLNGHRYPLEIHFVHSAADGSLGVVGVFAESGEANPVLQAVLEATGAAAGAGQPTLDLMAMLPAARDYFRYAGSLTTPPCSETVDWAVLAEPITVSDFQIDAFTRLHPGNTRPLQPLHRRFLLQSGQ